MGMNTKQIKSTIKTLKKVKKAVKKMRKDNPSHRYAMLDDSKCVVATHFGGSFSLNVCTLFKHLYLLHPDHRGENAIQRKVCTLFYSEPVLGCITTPKMWLKQYKVVNKFLKEELNKSLS